MNVTKKGLSKGTTFGVPSSESVQVMSINAFEEIDNAVPNKTIRIDVDISMVPHDVLTLSRLGMFRFTLLVLKSRSLALCWVSRMRRLFVAMNWFQNNQQFDIKAPGNINLITAVHLPNEYVLVCFTSVWGF